MFRKKNPLLERRALPMGRGEFEVWAARIIEIANITADVESQKFALADMLLHLGPAESHKEDAHFVHYLRKVAVNQVADAIRCEIRDKTKARLKEESDKNSQINETKILANEKIQTVAG